MERQEPNRIVDFFKNKTIFITGGTGFLGKVLIEKLLRSCTGLKKIYVLMRVKKGKSVNERLQEIFDGPLFELLKKQQGKIIFEKVEPILGDVESSDLGLSPEDRKKICEEVEIIYHSAATVQFDEPFRKTVLLNVRGTKLMLELAKECKNLKGFCHVSTAYCQENQEVLYEKTYPPPTDPHRIIEMCEWMDDKTLNSIAREIRGSSANTYTFTKALGEGLVAEQMDSLPIIIARPSAVIPIWKEPLPGWTDNINGPTGLLIGVGKGVIRSMYGRGDCFADYVTVDVIANALICVMYDFATYGSRRVYNMTGSDEVKLTFQEILDLGRNIIEKRVSFDYVLWYPGGTLTNNRLIFYINLILFQLLPAVFLDIILFMIGVKPFLIRVQKKILRGYQVFEYYANRQWDFRKENSETARKLLNDTEKRVFKVDSEGVNIEDYFTECFLGARRFLMKERDENVPNALRRLKIMRFIDVLCKTLFFVGVFYFIYNKFIASYL